MSFFNAINDPLFRVLLEQSKPQQQKDFAPNFDVSESGNVYILEGELPGLADKKAISIEFTDGQTVVITGKVERTFDPEEKGKEVASTQAPPKVWVTERSVGSFRRVFRFPTQVDTNGVKASLEHGILSMVVPKKKVEKKTIVIE